MAPTNNPPSRKHLQIATGCVGLNRKSGGGGGGGADLESKSIHEVLHRPQPPYNDCIKLD